MDIKEKFSKKRNMLEHMLGLHALSYASLPASSLYDDACLEKIKQVSESSHIYMIGVQPKIDTHDVFLNEEFFCIKLKIDGEKDLGVIKFGIPEGFTFETKDGYSYIIDREGTKLAPTEDRVTAAIAEQLGPIPFHVKYIGQAYGKDGKRNVVDRLKKT